MSQLDLTNPKAFYKLIPKSIPENLEFRKNLYKQLATDLGFKKAFLELSWQKPSIFFSSCMFTFNPKNAPGYRNPPFILRPQQEIVVDNLHNAIVNSSKYERPEDRALDKSRDEGATVILCSLFDFHWLVMSESMFLLGSRKEEFVDKSTEIQGKRVLGDHKCLFHKVLYGIMTLPECLRPKHWKKTHMHFENLENGSCIDGEATNESFGGGDRRTAVGVDEFGLIESRIAETIRHTLSDVTYCVIYNSTQGPMSGHPYSKLINSGKLKTLILPWESNPTKNQGIYRSPDYDKIEILDISFYRKACPDLFNTIKPKEAFVLSKLEKECLTCSEKIQRQYAVISRRKDGQVFIADGGDGNDGGWRSPWYDAEDERRDRQDVARNIDRKAVESGDRFFDESICKKIEIQYIREPDFAGEIVFEKDKSGRIRSAKFKEGFGRRRFSWWGNLVSGRPPQLYNYVVACDISGGTGASNSVIGVYNVNLYEKVGQFVCPNTSPERLADYTVALCKWIGGATSQSFLGWEANGVGATFGRRVLFHSYPFVYINRDERARTKKRKNRYGWWSTSGQNGSKFDLLSELRAGLREGLKDKAEIQYKALIIHDSETLREYRDYKYLSNSEIGLSESIDESSGARFSHGDRVIADGIGLLLMETQPKASINEIKEYPRESFGYRFQQWKEEKAKKNMNYRRDLF